MVCLLPGQSLELEKGVYISGGLPLTCHLGAKDRDPGSLLWQWGVAGRLLSGECSPSHHAFLLHSLAVAGELRVHTTASKQQACKRGVEVGVGGSGPRPLCAEPLLPLPFLLQGVPFPQNEANAMDVVVQFAIYRLGFQPQDIIIYAWSIGGFTGISLPPNHPHNLRHPHPTPR